MTDLDHAHRDLALARQRLHDFEASATSEDYLARLAAECPAHATRLGMLGFPLIGAALTVAAVAWLALPLASHGAQVFVAWVDPLAVVPLWLLANSLAALVLSLLFRHLAVLRGRRSPLRDKERRRHAGLVGAVWRCEARLALAEADLATAGGAYVHGSSDTSFPSSDSRAAIHAWTGATPMGASAS